MDDDDIMPFGKFEGVTMDMVPDYYLVWLWEGEGGPEYWNIKKHMGHKWSGLHDYIKAALSDLRKKFTIQHT